MDKILHDAVAAIVTFLLSLVPAAVGSTVSLAFEAGLTWAQRFVQLFVGIAVSYFATNLVTAIYPVSEPVRQAIGFVAGLIAFKAAPRFRDEVVDAVAGIPGQIRDAIPFLRRKDRP